MSSFFDFVNSLRPDWKREAMEEDLNQLITELVNITIPMAEKFDHSIGKTLHSAQGKHYAELYRNTTGTKTPMVEHITEVMLNALDCLNKLLDFNSRVFTETTVVSAAMSFKKASIIRYIETVRFASDYTRMLLHFLSVAETKAEDDSVSISGAFTNADIEYLNTRFISFAETCRSINVKETEFTKKMDAIPNTPINDSNESVLRNTRGDNTVDPLNLCFLPIYLNPFYHIVMGLASYQSNRYKDAVNELKVLELRLANLDKIKNNGTHDTQLEAQIKITERQITDARYELTKLNKKYGIDGESATAIDLSKGFILSKTVMPLTTHKIFNVKDVLYYAK